MGEGARPRTGVLLTVAYDGTPFSGFVYQPRARTVEGELRGALAKVDPGAGRTWPASRTDAGVHASGQLVSFDAAFPLPPRGWVLALNRHLPDEIAVRRAQLVPSGFNPRFASRWKRYRYRLLLDRVRDPHLVTRAWRLGWKIDVERMVRELDGLLGTHDFAAFRSAHDGREITVRTLHRVALERSSDPRILELVVEGSAFLYNMVRILAGTLVDVGRVRIPPGAFLRALRSKDRADLGETAPAHGLTLEHIEWERPDGTGDPWPG